MRILIMTVVLVSACAGDEPPAGTPLCTMALYDTCIDEHNCLSNSCHNFAGDGIQVCTQGCSASNPCPMLGTLEVECNSMGVCKPPMANVCKVAP